MNSKGYPPKNLPDAFPEYSETADEPVSVTAISGFSGEASGRFSLGKINLHSNLKKTN